MGSRDDDWEVSSSSLSLSDSKCSKSEELAESAEWRPRSGCKGRSSMVWCASSDAVDVLRPCCQRSVVSIAYIHYSLQDHCNVSTSSSDRASHLYANNSIR